MHFAALGSALETTTEQTKPLQHDIIDCTAIKNQLAGSDNQTVERFGADQKCLDSFV